MSLPPLGPPLTLPEKPTPLEFEDGPGQHIVRQVLSKLKTFPAYDRIFGRNVYDYQKDDLSTDDLPALMMFETRETYDPRFLRGVLRMWVILPHGMDQGDALAFARACGKSLIEFNQTATWLFDSGTPELDTHVVPGLSEFAQRGGANYERAFSLINNDAAPALEVTADYAVDFRVWEAWLEEQCRDRNPFEDRLEQLLELYGTIEAHSTVQTVVDGDSPDTSLGFEQPTES